MTKKKVVVISEFHPAGIKLLQAREDIDLVIVKDPTPENISKAVVNADVITIRTQKITREQLALAPNLKLISRYGVGTDNIDMAYCNEKKIPVAITVGGNDKSVAEHAFTLIMSLAKDMKMSDKAIQDSNWKYRDTRSIHDLYDKNVLILGFGRIGQRVARFCQAFSMNVTAYDPYLPKSPVENVKLVKDFHSELAHADFVTLHLPLTKETNGLFGKRELSMMKDGSFFINTARGELVHEDDLLEALNSKKLKGVGLDVFSHEPPDPSHPLFKHDRSFFTPHAGGMSEECTSNLAVMTVQRIFECFEGKLDLSYVFNRKEIGS
ncbi:hydroxyacid dehydrogenase [Zophobihabitans entericus]|uniref:Hydroxyacid dehydrogenase n=1 Tax=Zophobihabitans entericus TaxID=1635327 RepID=A0A6G9I954_9GAMM|nr:hydroxyacid dehydrogenase [Zophobihabitans entericus]QIQ20387.1 hydroxyacid dehydrogenase [Zophobihabitans entericus]